MHDRPVSRWLDAFFASYFARRPVNATFIGVHDHDDRLPDLSEHGSGDTVAEMRALLDDARALEPALSLDARPLQTPGSPPAPARHRREDQEEVVDRPAFSAHDATAAGIEAIDLRLARGFLQIELREFESRHLRRNNPSLHTGEAVFGVLSLLLTDFAPLADRLDAATSRMAAIPTFLAHARATLDRAPISWTDRALDECEGARLLFTDGVRRFLAGSGRTSPSFLAAADRAASAFADHASWLRSDLRARPAENVGCGEEMLSLYLSEGHALDMDADGVLALAQASLVEAESDLAHALASLGLPDTKAANAALAERHPQLENYLSRFGGIWNEVHALAGKQDLVTWPDLPLRFVPRPTWVRGAAEHLYFLFYRSPAAYGRPAVHEHLVLPIDDSMPEARRLELLRANHDAVIRLNHVIHHAGLGHHVQNAHAFRSPSRIGRIAAVDCAARIALFCGGTMAEGWACYATELAGEFEALSRLEEVSELQTRMRMAVRAIVDVELHRGRITLEDAIALYGSRAGMSQAAARGEAVKNSMNPGVALMYLVGTHGIRELRRELEIREGAAFRLRRFHDALLSWGSIPVAIIAKEMLRAV